MTYEIYSLKYLVFLLKCTFVLHIHIVINSLLILFTFFLCKKYLYCVRVTMFQCTFGQWNVGGKSVHQSNVYIFFFIALPVGIHKTIVYSHRIFFFAKL